MKHYKPHRLWLPEVILIPKKQTRLHKGLHPISDRGNCFPACIASILEMEVEDVIQIQEYYDDPEWPNILQRWLNSKGYRWRSIEQGEDVRGKYILVSGTSPRFSNCTHIVIYKDGVMVHDPHPDNTGILDERDFEIIEKK